VAAPSARVPRVPSWSVADGAYPLSMDINFTFLTSPGNSSCSTRSDISALGGSGRFYLKLFCVWQALRRFPFLFLHRRMRNGRFFYSLLSVGCLARCSFSIPTVAGEQPCSRSHRSMFRCEHASPALQRNGVVYAGSEAGNVVSNYLFSWYDTNSRPTLGSAAYRSERYHAGFESRRSALTLSGDNATK